MAAPVKGTKFSGPIIVGRDDGTANPALGYVEVTQRVSVSAKGPSVAVNVPACHLVGFTYIQHAAQVDSSAASVRFGTSADQTQYGSVSVSAVGTYYVTSTSGAAMQALGSGATVVVDVTSLGSAGASTGQAFIRYMPTGQL